MTLQIIPSGVPTRTMLQAIANQNHCTGTTSQRLGLGSPPVGLHWFDTSMGVDFYWDGSAWRMLPQGLVGYLTTSQTGPGVASTAVGVNGSHVTWDAYAKQFYEVNVLLAITVNFPTPVTWAQYVDFGHGAGYQLIDQYDVYPYYHDGSGFVTGVAYHFETTRIVYCPTDSPGAKTRNTVQLASPAQVTVSGGGQSFIKHLGENP